MPDTLVLCYHAVSERWPADLSVTPGALRSQLAGLVRRGYRGVTFSEAVTEPAAGRRVAVSFDDGYLSVLELAAPILEELGLPGTVFVPTNFMDRPEPMAWAGIDQWLEGPHREELRPISWADARALTSRGWEIGSHTCSHPHLTTLDDATLERELVESRQACEEHLSGACLSIAYPYGDVDRRVVEAAGRAGYQAGASLPARWHAEEPLDWPRAGVWHGDGPGKFRLKASPTVRRFRGLAGRTTTGAR